MSCKSYFKWLVISTLVGVERKKSANYFQSTNLLAIRSLYGLLSKNLKRFPEECVTSKLFKAYANHYSGNNENVVIFIKSSKIQILPFLTSLLCAPDGKTSVKAI